MSDVELAQADVDAIEDMARAQVDAGRERPYWAAIDIMTRKKNLPPDHPYCIAMRDEFELAFGIALEDAAVADEAFGDDDGAS